MSSPLVARPQFADSRGRARLMAQGTWRPWANPAQVRDHVRELLKISTFQGIGKAANVGQMTVWEIANGARPVIKAGTATALLEVKPADLRPQRVDANGSMWRLRSLMAMGHTSGRIARALGASGNITGPLIRGERATVRASLRDDINRLFDAWWDKRPPRRTPAGKTAAGKTLRRAAAHNWPCPAALDEGELDLPGYKPAARWRYAHGTGIAGDDPLGKKRQKEPEPGRSGGQTDRPAETGREAGQAGRGKDMAYPKDENDRYFIPSKDGETRIEADCASCGSGWNVPERVWNWFSFCHEREHRKGHNGLAALPDIELRRFEPGKPAQPEPEAAG